MCRTSRQDQGKSVQSKGTGKRIVRSGAVYWISLSSETQCTALTLMFCCGFVSTALLKELRTSAFVSYVSPRTPPVCRACRGSRSSQKVWLSPRQLSKESLQTLLLSAEVTRTPRRTRNEMPQKAATAGTARDYSRSEDIQERDASTAVH